MSLIRRVLPPARAMVIGVQARGGQRMQRGGEFGGAGPQGDEPDAAVGELGELVLGGDLAVEDQQLRVVPGHGVPVVGEGEDFVVLGGLGQVRVGVEQSVAVGVLGEERQNASGALGSAWYVVLFQRRVVPPVHDGVEVQVDRVAGGQPGLEAGLVQSGQERGLLGVFEPVGVGGQRGGLGQRGQAGEQRRTGVGGQFLDVGDPAGAGELERQQRQHRTHRRDDRGARIAGVCDQAGQIQGDQVRDGQQQPGELGVDLFGPLVEVHHAGARLGLAPRQATLGVRARPHPREAFLGEHLGHPGPVQLGALGGQDLGDLIRRPASPAQLDDPGPSGVLGRCALRAGFGVGEEVPSAGPEVSGHRLHAGGGVAEPAGRLRCARPLQQVGPQRLVPALVRGGGLREEQVEDVSTALYRRYRPETFADVIGQEHVTEPLMQALRTGRVGHAYLFSGPRGCGKTTSARILARCLNCADGPTPQPCGTCDSCVALARGGPGSVDVIEIDAASHGGVDDARDLRERASYGPAQSRYKVYIIDEAHMVTPQGFNALLKIVEEPPEHVKFVFATTEPEKVIGTIRSRTHHYPFRLVPPAKLTQYLEQLCEREGVSVAPGVLGFVVRAGGGSVRDALSVLDQLIAGSGPEGLTDEGAAGLLGFTSAELLDATIDAIAAGDSAALFTVVDQVVESGHDPRRFAMDLLERLRDLIILAAVPDGAAQVLRGIPQDQLERMRAQQTRFGPGTLSRAADIVNAGITEMTGATSPRLHLELICARILLPGASGEHGYAARLDRLERRLDDGAAPAPGPGLLAPPVGPGGRRPAPPAEGLPGAQGDRAAAVPRPAASAAETPRAAVEVEHVEADGPAEIVVERVDAVIGPETGGSSAAPAPDGPMPTEHAEGPVTAQPDAAGPDAVGPATAGTLDLAAVRREWPRVLANIFTVRRVTWTFLSQHAQVVEYDGSRLVLGIATTGLANTFRQGNHAEVVRQALIDALAIDVRVEGRTLAPTDPAAAAPAPDQVRSAVDPGGQEPAESSAATIAPDPGVASSQQARGAPASSSRPVGGAPGRHAEPANGIEPDVTDAKPEPAPKRPRVRAAARHTAAPPVDPDDLVSIDDEDVHDDGESGQAIIERMLGGRVLDETTD